MTSSRVPLGLILLAATMLVGCVQAPRPQPTRLPSQSLPPTLPPTPTAETTTHGGGTVPPELVGTWMQENRSGGPTGYFTRKAYQFAPDGNYALVNLLCFTGGTCEDSEPPESSVATVIGNQLSLSPQTQSADGPRTYTFAVVRDPNLGDLRLQFHMPDYVDEFFWQP